MLCFCGCCREVTKEGNKFILGHSRKKIKSDPILCSCGCGNYAKPDRKFISGHNRKGKPSPNIGKTKETHESVRRMSETKIGRTKENDEGVKRQAEKMTGRSPWNKNLTKETHKSVKRIAEYMLNGGGVFAQSFNTQESHKIQSDRMKNGLSVHAASFIKNPSEPQVRLWKLVSKICPYVYLNYPVTHLKNTYSIDITIPKLNIAIEYDGSYWHQDKEKDLKRQEELEEDGWKFIRYINKLPPIDKVKEDILNLLKV